MKFDFFPQNLIKIFPTHARFIFVSFMLVQLEREAQKVSEIFDFIKKFYNKEVIVQKTTTFLVEI